MTQLINIANNRQLFVADFSIDSLTGAASLKLKQPEPQEVVLDTTAPWEGNTCAYYTLFRDGDLFRMLSAAGWRQWLRSECDSLPAGIPVICADSRCN